MALKLAAPASTLELGRAPKSAAGPDLRQLVLGSEGALGAITELTVQVRPLPETRVYGWRLQSFAHGISALRTLVQDGPVPTVLRLSDEAEMAVGLAQPGGLGKADGNAERCGAGGQSAGGGCLAIVGYEGSSGEVEARRQAVSATLNGGNDGVRRGRRLDARSLPRPLPARLPA